MNTHATLVRMANDIAKNFAVMGHIDAAKATADHIHQFWDPRMKQAVYADGTGLGEIARAAIDMLREAHVPGSQTRATQFNAVDEAGHFDAG